MTHVTGADENRALGPLRPITYDSRVVTEPALLLVVAGCPINTPTVTVAHVTDSSS